jgi:hypothetical protein
LSGDRLKPASNEAVNVTGRAIAHAEAAAYLPPVNVARWPNRIKGWASVTARLMASHHYAFAPAPPIPKDSFLIVLIGSGSQEKSRAFTLTGYDARTKNAKDSFVNAGNVGASLDELSSEMERATEINIIAINELDPAIIVGIQHWPAANGIRQYGLQFYP